MSAWAGVFRRLARTRLLTRVVLGLAAVGLLPVLIASFGLAGVNREALYDQVLHTHVVAAETTAARVGAFLATRQSLAAGAAANPALADPRSAAAQELLRQDLGAWSDLGVLALAVVNRQGEEAVRAQLSGPQVREQVRAALAARAPAEVAAVTVAGGQPPVLRFRAPLPQGGGALLLIADGAALSEAVRAVGLG
ncbi:MAG TPA: hypothetical protein VMM92_09720, partial [Thermoanaerobaculia bacterium]|nr:hypothetical protein [Thermoanaerobaculia bacterium]